jgi:23S rRNA (cytidine1920-2'-O)/16S rRNA (cytidine1409-2'-O)-methyltransferase
MTGRYVSRAGNKLESVAHILRLDLAGKSILDVGSSTGGFSDFALQHGAEEVLAVDKGTDQMSHRLRQNPKIKLLEKTDILDVNDLSTKIDTALLDVSFVSIRKILPHVASLVNSESDIVVLLKPQFEAKSDQKNEGKVKNETVRREILRDFERWVKPNFLIVAKADSEIHGRHGNRERFYKLRKTR